LQAAQLGFLPVKLVIRAALVFARKRFSFLSADGAIGGRWAWALVCGACVGEVGRLEGLLSVVGLWLCRAWLDCFWFLLIFDVGLPA
jgi:hypothetical protein